MANAFDLITKYSSKAWDKVYKAESRSALLDADKDLLKFTGVKTVKIAKFSSTGLSDYRRANTAITGGDYAGFTSGTSQGYGYGYAQGDAALVWEEFTIQCDRAAQYRIELFDDEETDGLAVATTTTEVSRVQVIPEVDAYCFSKIVEYAGKVVSEDIVNTTPSSNQANPLAALNAAFKHLEDEEVPEEDQIIFCSTEFRNLLRSTPELYRKLDQVEYSKDIKFTIEEYEGRKIIAVPPRRFRTLVNLVSGGYGWKQNSKAINFIVCAKSAIYHVTKYDKVRVFAPNVVQDFDGYKVNIRVYHDVFVPDNKRLAVYVSQKYTDTTASSGAVGGINRTISVEHDGGKIGRVLYNPADQLVSLYAVPDGDSTCYALNVDDTWTAGSNTIACVPYITVLAADTWKIFAVAGGKVMAKSDAITVS